MPPKGRKRKVPKPDVQAADESKADLPEAEEDPELPSAGTSNPVAELAAVGEAPEDQVSVPARALPGKTLSPDHC